MDRAEVNAALDRFGSMGDGWAEDDSKEATPIAVQVAKSIVETMEDKRLPDSVVPCHDGGIQLEWYRPIDLEVEIKPDGATVNLICPHHGDGGGIDWDNCIAWETPAPEPLSSAPARDQEGERDAR